MNWLPITQYSEEKYDLKWLTFSDGNAAATRLIYAPMIFDFGLPFQPTHFAVVDLPNETKAIEPPTVDNEPQQKRFPEETHYDEKGYCDNPARGF